MNDIGSFEAQLAGLQRLEPNAIPTGQPLPGSIHCSAGHILIQRGQILTAEGLRVIRQHAADGIYGGDGWPAQSCFVDSEKVAGLVGIDDDDATPPKTRPGDKGRRSGDARSSRLMPSSIDDLHVGSRLSKPIFARNGLLLLAAGIEITHEFLARLRSQQHYVVHVEASELDLNPPEPTPVSSSRLERRLDDVVEHLWQPELTLAASAIPRRDLDLVCLREELEYGREMYRLALDRVTEISQDVYRGKCTSIVVASEVVAHFLELLESDSSLLPAIVKLTDAPTEYLYQHGLNVALLAMSAASQLGLRRQTLVAIGLGALLQDVGMMEVPEQLRLATRRLSAEERREITRHPLYTLNFLQQIEGLDEISLLICYQSHERVNGTGYPRKRTRTMIHPYARLVAAADAFAAICSHRPYREARSPYEAMEIVVRQAGQDVFDKTVVRNFLNCLSLFPIGSFVRLSDGRLAKVLRANHGQHTKPVVLMLNADGSESDCEVDLARAEQPHVIQALRALDEPVVRAG